MKSVQVCISLLFVCILAPGVLAAAGDGPASVGFDSLVEKDGYITGELTVTPLITGTTAGFVTLWLNTPGGDCEAARFLGWRHLTMGDEPVKFSVAAPVPLGMTTGTYEVRAVFGPGDLVPVSCDQGPSVVSPLVITTPGAIDRNMSGRLADAAGSGVPDYQIDAIAGIDTAVRVAPGEVIQPVLTIHNAGEDDSSGVPVEVHAYLGTDDLIPVTALVDPLKRGESRTVTLSFQIQDSMAQRGYPFFVILDPSGVHGIADAETNLKKTGGQMSVHIEDPGVDCGCK